MMKLSWTKGMTAKQKEDITNEFLTCPSVRKQLAKILQEKIDAKRKGSVLVDAYENPNWALKQADAVGYERALIEVISIISD